MPTKPCIQCGEEFEPQTSGSKHCSAKCFREKERAYARRHTSAFSPERKRASSLVATALFNGVLKRQPCEVCGGGRTKPFGGDVVQAHHDDYAKPLEVRWLCRSHHKQHHHKHGPGLNAFRATESA